MFVGVEKMSVSFDLELGEAIRASASDAGQNVSAWLADAARQRLRTEALGEAVADWEQRFGPLDEAEVGEAERVLEQATERPRRGAV